MEESKIINEIVYEVLQTSWIKKFPDISRNPLCSLISWYTASLHAHACVCVCVCGWGGGYCVSERERKREREKDELKPDVVIELYSSLSFSSPALEAVAGCVQCDFPVPHFLGEVCSPPPSGIMLQHCCLLISCCHIGATSK